MNLTTNPQIAKCSACREAFDAASPVGGLQVHLAQCGWCERRYYISLLTQPSADIILSEAAMSGFSPPDHLSAQSEFAMKQLIEAFPGTAGQRDNRRKSARVRAAFRLVVAPLDDEFRPLTLARDAASIDVSATGISFVVKSDFEAHFWMIDFGPTTLPGTQAVMKIVRKESLGEGCWKIAGPLVTELSMSTRPAKVHTCYA